MFALSCPRGTGSRRQLRINPSLKAQPPSKYKVWGRQETERASRKEKNKWRVCLVCVCIQSVCICVRGVEYCTYQFRLPVDECVRLGQQFKPPTKALFVLVCVSRRRLHSLLRLSTEQTSRPHAQLNKSVQSITASPVKMQTGSSLFPLPAHSLRAAGRAARVTGLSVNHQLRDANTSPLTHW